MASLNSVSESHQYPYPIEVRVSAFVPIKLSGGSNYSRWRKLMLRLVETQGLVGFVNGEVSAPVETMEVPDGNHNSTQGTKQIENQEYRAWKRSDALLQSWILETINEDLFEIVEDLKTAQHMWTTLEMAFKDFLIKVKEEYYPYPSEVKVTKFVPIRLFRGNYFMWRQLMLALVESQGLGGFISGQVSAPPTMIILPDDSSIIGEAIENASDDSSVICDDTKGIMNAKTMENHDYKAWKKSDALLQSWILGTLSEDLIRMVVNCETAREMWTTLEEIMEDSSDSESETDRNVEEKDLQLYKSLYNAVIKGEWKSVQKVLKEKPEVVKAKITRKSYTLLMLALKAKRSDQFVKNLLKHMSKDDLTVTNSFGITALHRAAIEGNVEAAKLMIKINPDLPNLCVEDEVYPPLFYAARWGRRDMTLYLLQLTREDFITNGDDGAEIVRRLINNSMYDIALQLVKRYKLACKRPSPLELLAMEPSAFPSRTRFSWWQNLIYRYVPLKFEEPAYCNGGDIENPTAINGFVSVVMQKLLVVFWKLTELLVPQMKQIQGKKLRHSHALELLRYVCKEMDEMKCPIEMVGRAFNSAVDWGIYEVIEEISVTFPKGFYRYGMNYSEIFHSAIINRNQKVFNLIYQFRKEDASFFLSRRDEFDNNGLHLAGCLQNEQRLQLRIEAAGAALQMQRELQWFKEVEKLLPSKERHVENANNKTPLKLFTETHQDLVKEGEQWMKDTATSCTIVAALIVTITFATAMTVPGGNNEESGLPIFSKNEVFKVFGVSDALALFTSTSSVLMFLSILTSRYSEADFLFDLPTKLIIGLVTLFVSIISMILAFSIAFYLVFGDEKVWILIPVIIFACIPVTLFASLQFPLLFTMIKSTYFPHIFHKQSDRVLM